MDHRIEDKLQSMMAMTHALQNRIMQAACTGKMSENVAEEISRMSSQIVGDAKKVSQFTKENGG
jgi:hypothetical protein